MNEIKDRKATISARVQEHYDYLVAAGYEVVFTALQGSQNYGLDEYSNDYCSDIDTKSIVLPNLDDFINAKQPVSAVEILDNEEHAEVKDIRVMFEMFKKENISYIELLYSDYIIFNPKYKDLIKPIFEKRDEIVAADTAQFLKCIAGMAYEKDKALCHPYPGIIDKIEKYGYDGKQLSHCARLLLFMSDFEAGRPVQDCYKPAAAYKETLMNYKKQLDENGDALPVEEARSRSKEYVERIKSLKNKMLETNEYGVDTSVWVFLNEIKAKILKYKITKEIIFDYYKEEKQMRYITLDKKDYFRVVSRATDRIVTVVGLYLEGTDVIRYEINGEGNWPTSRFDRLVETISYNEFYDLQKRVELLEKKLDSKIVIDLKY